MDRRLNYIWWGILGILLAASLVKFLLPVKSPVQLEQSSVNKEIIVYITGAVENSGLLSLPLDARLDDALKQARLSLNADVELLNPAQRLKDGQKIIVPYKIDLNQNDSGADGITEQAVSGGQVLININTAGSAQLESIPGIGPVLAQRIIDYREKNGFFSSPEEIQNVSGIGPKTYENMSSYIKVGP